jgi:hypothetical protein
MSKSFVAVTDIRHGEGDKIKSFKRGDSVTGLKGDTMVELWLAGSLAEKDSPMDPNTWPDAGAGVAATTPRFVDEVLRAQLAAAGAPAGVDVPKTQGDREAHKDPEKLLTGTGVGDDAPSEPTPANVATNSTGVPNPQGQGATDEAEAAAREAEEEANEAADKAAKSGKAGGA